jgi:hypothetical protein
MKELPDQWKEYIIVPFYKLLSLLSTSQTFIQYLPLKVKNIDEVSGDHKYGFDVTDPLTN